MNPLDRTARRYHWLSEGLMDFVVEPHRAVCSELSARTLNMVARESEGAREVSASIARERPEKLVMEMKLILPGRHDIRPADVGAGRLRSILLRTYERQPEDFEGLLGIEGVGPKTIRALSLLSELIYGKPPSYRDPARFSFAHGGKDGTPFPVDRGTYDRTIEVMQRAIQSARLGNADRVRAIRRLNAYFGEGA
jgi:hypothetical protein